jgi:glycosyltransferase involved in cell wall biosynthesis
MGRFLRFLIEGGGQERKFVGLAATGEIDSSLFLRSEGFRNHLLWEQISLPRVIAKNGFRVFVAPYNTAPLFLSKHVKLVLVVHDLIFLQNMALSPSMHQNIGRIYRRAVVPRAIARADIIVTVSRFVQGEITARFGIPEDRIHVIPNTLDEAWYSDTTTSEPREHYVLLVTGEAPSKNLIRAIHGFAVLVRKMGDPRMRLKVVGVKPKYQPVFRAKARLIGVDQRVDFFDHVAKTDLQAMYRNAGLFVMPSLAEGFGIPLLEAMASGTPVAASRTTSLPEICGNAALYFDPLSMDEMADCMHKILSDQGLQAKLREEGRRRVIEFHPNLVREKVRHLWNHVLDSERGSSST